MAAGSPCRVSLRMPEFCGLLLRETRRQIKVSTLNAVWDLVAQTGVLRLGSVWQR